MIIAAILYIELYSLRFWTVCMTGQPYLLEPRPAKLSYKIENIFSLQIFLSLARYMLPMQLVTDFKNKSCPQINASLCPVIVKSRQIKEDPEVEPPGRRLNLLTIFSISRYLKTSMNIHLKLFFSIY